MSAARVTPLRAPKGARRTDLDERVEAVTVKIVKLALSEADELIGITLRRERR